MQELVPPFHWGSSWGLGSWWYSLNLYFLGTPRRDVTLRRFCRCSKQDCLTVWFSYTFGQGWVKNLLYRLRTYRAGLRNLLSGSQGPMLTSESQPSLKHIGSSLHGFENIQLNITGFVMSA